MSNESLPLLRPRPRRPFELTPLSSTAGSSPDGRTTPDLQLAGGDDSGNPPSRTRSFLNLTASTLFGIYAPTGYAPDETPWGTGAQTPIDSKGVNMAEIDGQSVDDALLMRSKQRRGSMVQASTRRTQNKKPRKKTFKNYVLPLVGQNVILGIAGVIYGQLIAHLHDRSPLVPVQIEGMPSDSWAYLAYWCFSGMALGQALPWVDSIWEGDPDSSRYAGEEYRASGNVGSAQDTQEHTRSQHWTPGWNEVVRFIGAAVGIVFAIRRLPWQSPLQLSLTLALANPAIWFLLDRTPPCFILSTTVALSGTALLLSINPELIPSPSVHASSSSVLSGIGNATASASEQNLIAGFFTLESIGVATWVASVLFVSCVCFGNIGRRL